MTTQKHASTEDFCPALAALGRGDSLPLDRLGTPPAAVETLRRILKNYSFNPPAGVDSLLARILSSPRPESGIRRIEGVLSAGYISADAFTEGVAVMLAAAAVWSEALSRRLGGDPALVPLLASIPSPLDARTEKAYYLERFRAAGDGSRDPSGRIRALHRAHTTELVRILARNGDPSVSIAVVNAELSALADAAIEECLAVSEDESGCGGRPVPGEAGFVVLGLGKLGGRELNVSSDIDLVYLYEDRDRGGGDDLIVPCTRLAERLTGRLSEATESGALYRVDTRLRADGASGPLVRSTRDYFRYLEMRGEAWERQMLLKARPAAGDTETGELFLRSLERFVYPSTVTRSPNREIAALKTAIEARLAADGSKGTHLKLRPGGIRDIEFVVQCLQLLTGGVRSEVRIAGTLPALDALRTCGALTEREHAILSESYILFRRVENILQWENLAPAFTLPSDGADFDDIARFLGYDPDGEPPGRLLKADLDRRFDEVRAIFDEVFAGGEPGVSAPSGTAALVYGAPGESNRRLEALGFPEPERSARTLARLFDGAPGGETDASPSEPFAKALFALLSDLPDPGGALERFSMIVEAYHARKTLFDILAGTPKLLELLVLVAHSSVHLTDILAGDPSLLDWLVEGGGLLSSPKSRDLTAELRRIDRVTGPDAIFSARTSAIKRREELRTGARAVSGLADTPAVFAELTAVAGCAVAAAVERATRLAGTGRGLAFAVIAAGRLGAETMNFGSDLDLIFVHRGGGTDAGERAVRLARSVVSLLTGGGGAHKTYDIDARLRPEGGNAVLSVPFEEYRRYLDTRASGWERLAMVRARFAAGNARLGRDVMEIVGEFVYRRPFSADGIDRILTIRERAVEQSRKRHPGLINVKSGPGGLSDIDFIAQTFAAHSGGVHPAVRLRRTADILAALPDRGLLDRDDARSLAEAHRFLSDAELAIRIGTGRPVNTIPPEGAEAARIARLLGFQNPPRLVKKVREVMAVTRDRFDRLMRGLRSAAGGPPGEG